MNKLCTFDLSVQLNPGVSIFCFELRELYTTLLFGTKKKSSLEDTHYTDFLTLLTHLLI